MEKLMYTKEQVEDHDWTSAKLKAVIEAEYDMRELAREDLLFLGLEGGQWEADIATQDKPQYTFDMVDPIIDQVAGDLERSDFGIQVSPASGEGSEEAAKVYEGLIRHIENISRPRAGHVYNRSSRRSITCGLDGWRVIQQYADGDSFDQDLVISSVPNWLDRVWLGPHYEQDGSDCTIAWVLTSVDKDSYEQSYPDRSARGVDVAKANDAFYYKADGVVVGEFLYLVEESRELVQMSDGSVYEDDDDFKATADELKLMGVVEVQRRERSKKVVHSRLFDGEGWLTEARPTIFEQWLPVIPLYSGFDVIEDKVVYRGAVRKLKDPQRVMNYSLSREIEEGALAPRAKYWMSHKQAEGADDLETLNTNTHPVQFFTPDPELPGPPMQQGGAQINPGLRTISEAMRDIIGQSAGMFAASMGDNPGLQSGKAIEALQDKGSVGSNKYAESREVAQEHTARILVNAIPRVYQSGRQVRLIGEDGKHETKVLGQPVPDQQTGTMRVLEDLTVGSYDVVCRSGPSFKNRQSETVRAIAEIGAIDPTIVTTGADILLKSIGTPGMDQIAERKRQELFKAGMIPETQMNEEEKMQLQQMQQQPPPESPEMVLAKAEETKGQADLLAQQIKMQQIQSDAQDKQAQRQIDSYQAETDRFKAETERAKAIAEIKGKGADAALALARAEEIDISNVAAESGIMELVERVNGAEASYG